MIQKKVCMLGSFSVGKTSLVRRFVETIFDEKYQTTIGVKMDKKVVQTDGDEVTLVLWDIHGEDALQKMRMSYLRGMSGYLLVVDPPAARLSTTRYRCRSASRKRIGSPPSVLLLNKFDLYGGMGNRSGSRGSARRPRRGTVIHTSAKTGDGVEEGFSRLAWRCANLPCDPTFRS